MECVNNNQFYTPYTYIDTYIQTQICVVVHLIKNKKSVVVQK